MTTPPDAPKRTRRAPSERLEELVDAATSVLSRKSIARAQMTDVAAEMGVSAGNLYNYVEGKDALLPLVLRRTLDGQLPSADALPLAAPPLAETFAWLDRRLDWSGDFPVLEAALARRRASQLEGEVGDVAVELYAVLARFRPVVSVLERSGGDVPELGRLLRRVRGELFGRMEQYVELRRRRLRQLPSRPLAARLLVEAIVYVALRRPVDPQPPAGAEDEVREAVRAMAVHHLLPDSELGR
jgi:AcrR family transcriptional regulator